MSAAWYGTPEAVRVLVQNGAIVNLQDFEVYYYIYFSYNVSICTVIKILWI